MSDDEKNIEIIDLDVIRPKPRKVKIKGKEIDVSVIPFDITIDIAEHYDLFMKLGKALINKKDINPLREIEGKQIKDVLRFLYQCVVKILSNADSTIDEEWVKRNVSYDQMNILIREVMKPLLAGEPGAVEKKTE